MIVVKIESWPHGDETKKKQIGEVTITNDGTGTLEHGNYTVEVAHGGKFFGKPGQYRIGDVKGHWRNLSPYHLVLSALKSALHR